MRSNSEIRELYHEPDIVGVVKANETEVNWACRKNGKERMPKKAMDGHPGGRRLRMRWLEDVEEEAIRRLGIRRWQVKAQGREIWKEIVKKAKGLVEDAADITEIGEFGQADGLLSMLCVMLISESEYRPSSYVHLTNPQLEPKFLINNSQITFSFSCMDFHLHETTMLPSIAVSTNEQNLFTSENKFKSALYGEVTIRKVEIIRDRIGMVCSGIGADYRLVVRLTSKKNAPAILLNGEKIQIPHTVQRVVMVMQEYIQSGL
uniref:Uncharacterized protein n=1 Tax=Rhodnius prolixus TaxID=13249 RepID=T1HZ32_RHOPR